MSAKDELNEDDKDVLLLLAYSDERVTASHISDVLPQLDTRQAHYRANKLSGLGLAKKIKKGDGQLDPVKITTSDLGEEVADKIENSHDSLRAEVHDLRRKHKSLMEEYVSLRKEYDSVVEELEELRGVMDDHQQQISGIQRYLDEKE
jgi:uncharacterized coiled-coil DUF342 family protein